MKDRVLVIAEAGVNHNGSLDIAKQLILAAKHSGVDIVKFQTAKLNSLVSKFAEMAEYQKNNTGRIESQKEMLSRLLLSYEDFIELSKYCKEIGIEFLSTPFDIESIHFLSQHVNFWKIPSGEITNYPYLVEIAKTAKPVLMSTGMSDLDEISDAVHVLKEHGCTNITLLHCNTQYPTPMSNVNLRAMQTISEKFGMPVGYSDHTRGIEVPIAAVALGATVIEKHFTLDRNMEGPDHKASLEPDELKAMVSAIRNIEEALGSKEKIVTLSESGNKTIARKSIVAARDIERGEIFTGENITVKRPGNGISPMKWNEVIGQKATRDFSEDELIEF